MTQCLDRARFNAQYARRGGWWPLFFVLVFSAPDFALPVTTSTTLGSGGVSAVGGTATSTVTAVGAPSVPVSTPAPAPVSAATARINELRDRVQKNPNDRKAQLELGKALLVARQFDESLVHLRKANEEPSADALRALSVLYRLRKDDLQVVRAQEDLVTLNPKDYRAYNDLANAYVKINKFDQAIENYRKCLEIYPKFRPAYKGLIEVYQKRKSIFEIRTVLGTMLEVFPKDPEVLTQLCQYYALDSLFDKGMEYCAQAMKATPQNPDTRIFYGLMENGKVGNRKGTVRILETAKKFPKSAFAQISAARVSVEDKSWEAASRFYRQVTKLNATDGEAWLGAAQAEFNGGNYGEALKLYLEACRFNFRAYNELVHSTGVLGVQKQEKWYRQYRDSQDKCSVVKPI